MCTTTDLVASKLEQQHEEKGHGCDKDNEHASIDYGPQEHVAGSCRCGASSDGVVGFSVAIRISSRNRKVDCIGTATTHNTQHNVFFFFFVLCFFFRCSL